jgi:hypothetical protein
MKHKRRHLLVTLMIGLVLLVAMGCQNVDKPMVKGQGELALEVMEGVPAPEYHNPKAKWTATHMDLLSKGQVILPNGQIQEITQAECQGCHTDPDKFCNRCHRYVGVKTVSY